MKKLILAVAMLSACVFAGDTTKTEVKGYEFTPVLKSETILTSVLEDGARPTIIFGDNDLGVMFTKDLLEVKAVLSLADVTLSKVYIKQGFENGVNLLAGYSELPYGSWTSNCVNYPLVRTGNYDPAYESYKIKQYAPQVGGGYSNDVIEATVAGYVGENGNSTSLAAKIGADFTIIAPNLSVRADNMDDVELAIGADIDLGVVGIYGVYSRGINVDRMGSYVEVSVFPTDFLITAIRADLLANTDTKDGLSSFSFSNLFLITDNIYAGIEYTLQSDVVDTELQKPYHLLTTLIGFQF